MKIEAPTRAEVLEVAQNMREADRIEYMASFKDVTWPELPALLADVYGDAETSFCAYLNDDPVAVGAAIPVNPELLRIGMFATKDFPRIAFSLTKFVKNRLFPAYVARGFVRIECLSLSTYKDAHRWIETLGLVEEKTHEGIGTGGEDFIQFGRSYDVAR